MGLPKRKYRRPGTEGAMRGGTKDSSTPSTSVFRARGTIFSSSRDCTHHKGQRLGCVLIPQTLKVTSILSAFQLACLHPQQKGGKRIGKEVIKKGQSSKMRYKFADHILKQGEGANEASLCPV
eukprot:1156662-Pelagomonas_calceolata.AAC.9